MSARKNNAGVLMMQQAESGLTKDNLRAFRELYRILLDPKLEDYQSTRFKLGGGLVVWGRGGGVHGGQMQGIQMDCSENQEVAALQRGKVRGVVLAG